MSPTKLCGCSSIPVKQAMLGLYSFNLDITGVKVDGIDADFQQRAYSQERIHTTDHATSASEMAEHTFYEYQRLLQKEAEPELIIQLPDRIVGNTGEAAGQPMDSVDAKEQAKAEIAVTVAFALQQPTCGIHFHGQYAFTDAQVRRSRAWFPCLDVPLAACPFDLHFTVSANQLAVSCGKLMKQTLVDRGKRRCFHYKLAIPAPPHDIAFAIGPFQAWQAVVPTKPIQVKAGDAAAAAAASAAAAAATAGSAGPGATGSQYPPATPLQTPPYSALRTPKTPRTPAVGDAASRADVSVLTNFASSEARVMADHTLKTMGLAFNMFETYLGCKFPYKALQTVVLPEGLTRGGIQSGAGFQIFSGELMVTERTVEQAMEVRIAAARALAQQWFGVLMRPRTPADAWLLEGLTGYLADLFLRRFLGKNELRFRRHKEAHAIYMADDGQAPPLYCKANLALQWGSLYGTEHLDPSGLRKWKSTAVIWLLSGKVGEDIFRKHLERLVGNAVAHLQLGGSQAVDPAQNPLLLSSREFLRELGKGAGAKKELSALSLRWINLRGVPCITAAFTYHRKKNAIELAVRQQGSQAAQASTEQAAEQAAKEGSAVGLLRVVLKEYDHDNVHMLQLAAKPLLLQELKVDTKPGTKRGKKAGGRKKKDDPVGEEDLDEEEHTQQEQEAEDAAAADRPPVQWVEIDPQRETLAQVRLLQPDWMWAAQLENSKDTATQSAAVAGLAALRPTTYTVVSALEHCLQDDQVYPRVRQEAAMALAITASQETEFAGLQVLLKTFMARCNGTSSVHLQSQAEQASSGQTGSTAAAAGGSDVGEYLVNEALPLAIASVRDEHGKSPPEAVESLVDVLKHTDNRGNFYDDSSMLAACLQALGHLRLPDSKGLKQAVRQLDRFLARERVLPSYHAVVAQAALQAFVELALAMKGATQFVTRVGELCSAHTQATCHPELRRTAHNCLMRLAPGASGLNAAISLGLDAVQTETSPLVRLGLMEDLQHVVSQALQQTTQQNITPQQGPHDQPVSEISDVSPGILWRLHALFKQHTDVRLCHMAFMLLARLGGMPPTLYVPNEEPEAANAQEAAVSVQTQPVPGGSAAAKSGDDGKSQGKQQAAAQRLLPGKHLTELTEGEVRSPFRGDPAEPPFQVPASASGGNVHATDRQQQAQQPKQQLNTADMEPQATLAEPEQGQPRKKQKTDSAGTAALPAADRSASVAGLNNAAAPAAAAPAAAAASSMQASPPDRTAPVPQARAQPPDRGSVSGPGSGNADVQHQTQQRMAGSATASVGYTQPHQQQHSQPHQQQQQQQDTSMPPPRSSMGASSMHQAAAQTAGPAAAQPPSWEAERLRIKQLRQEEKLRLKAAETPEEKEARRKAKKEKKALRRAQGETVSMADSDGRTVDFSEITS